MLLLIPISYLILNELLIRARTSVSPTINYGKISLVQNGPQVPTTPFHPYADTASGS